MGTYRLKKNIITVEIHPCNTLPKLSLLDDDLKNFRRGK